MEDVPSQRQPSPKASMVFVDGATEYIQDEMRLAAIRRARDNAVSPWAKQHWVNTEHALMRQFKWRVLEESAGGRSRSSRG